MSQVIQYYMDDVEVCREMPDADDLVITGVRWGEPWALFTPAYWLSQLWMSGAGQQTSSRYRAGGNLHDEIVFCMLGGYGVTADLATAAFEACRNSGLISRLEPSATKWTEVLQQDLMLSGRMHRYRYPFQKASYLAGAMVFLQSHEIRSDCGRELRDSLLQIRGIGPKTAAWIARNYLDTDDVAILDVHLVRAGLLCELFLPSQHLQRDYFAMELRFIEFCRALNARPAVLDCLIWDQMRVTGSIARDALRAKLGDHPSSFARRSTPSQTSLTEGS